MRSPWWVSNSQFVHCDLVQGIEIAIAIGIGVDFIIDPGDFDPDFDPDPDEPSHIENCCWWVDKRSGMWDNLHVILGAACCPPVPRKADRPL